MSRVDELQKAIDENFQSLRDLYGQASGLKKIIDETKSQKTRQQLQSYYEGVMETFGKHVDITGKLIEALQKVIREET